jgi:hypothetical protein
MNKKDVKLNIWLAVLFTLLGFVGNLASNFLYEKYKNISFLYGWGSVIIFLIIIFIILWMVSKIK